MTAVAAEPEVSEERAGIPQYRLPMILFMFAWPAANPIGKAALAGVAAIALKKMMSQR